MDFRWLQDFLSLAEAGNFTSAADSRHSSQPAFSRRIQSLESWLGVELIDRSHYPTVLTPAGETFRLHAADLVRKMIDSRAELQGEPVDDLQTITFALPHSLAMSRFPVWWQEWQEGAGGGSCRLLASNVHDAVTALVSGLADILICYHHAQQPIFLDQAQYDRIELGTEWLRPYSAARRGQPVFKLPGKVRSPLPLLSYSSGAFLGRMVDIILDSITDKPHTMIACESDMANVLMEMAIAGHGIAWLPENMAASAVSTGRLKRAGDAHWALPLTINVYRHRTHATSAVNRLTAYLQSKAKQTSSDS